MQSLIIVGKDIEKVREEAASIFKKNKIDIIDASINISDKIFGIGDAREIQKKALLKPIKSPARGFAIIAVSGITTEAQNALLKILEEPHETTLIIIGVTNAELLLPTILSRCKIIELSDRAKKLEENLKILTISKAGVGDRLKLAQDYSKTKEDALLFLEQSISAARNKMLGSTDPAEYLNILKALQKTHKEISTINISPRFALENLLLNL